MNHRQSSNDIIATMESWFAKAPVLPKNVKEILVDIMPWIALIFGILGILSSVGGLGLLGATPPIAVMGGTDSMLVIIASVVWLASSILLLASYPGLKNHHYKGWTLLFWSELVSLVGAVVSVSSIIPGIISALITFYILFQIKSHYK